MFDEMELTPSTLEVVEPYLKKPHFIGDYLEKKTSNPAVGSLLQWVRGVVRYKPDTTVIPNRAFTDFSRVIFKILATGI